MLMITGGLMVAYCQRCAYEDLAKQYDHMRVVFENGDRELVRHLKNHDVTRAWRVFAALKREALLEHSQWLVLRGARALELPLGDRASCPSGDLG
jgi:hypothetical protein